MKSNTKTFGKDQKPTNQPCVKMSTDTARHIGLGGAICVIIEIGRASCRERV